ncbi:unnamed protein product [Heligmosomoides polygyrus]|uniref:Ground-like domain-containing protein n=1 Tax=Heligmosomoides polygyrus TaxID=6339 RepID=A0A183F3U7_HELPZ|nr:unnamed protein product [Heligmosomoides polygyrus]
MSYTNLVVASILLAMVIPSAGMFFGGGGGGCGGGGGGCGGGCGRKKRSTDDMDEIRFEAGHSDQLCNNPELKRFIRKHMVADPMTSKMNIVKALFPEGDHFFVVCTTGESLYSAPRSSIFCSHAALNHTCYVFGI